MAKIFNGVSNETKQNVMAKVQKMNNCTRFDNANKMETEADLLAAAESQANKLFEKYAFKCFVESLKANVKKDDNRKMLAKLYIKAYRLTQGFSVVLTESENKDNALKECTKVNGKTFWHKPLPQKTPHFYFAALKSGVKVAKQFAIMERKREKVLTFEQLFATKYAQIAPILPQELKKEIYKNYIESLNLNQD